MKNNRLLARLCSIRDKYAAVRALGDRLGSNFEPEELNAAVKQRERIIHEILGEQSEMERECSDWLTRGKSDSSLREIIQQIRSLIYSITDKDVILQKMVMEKMSGIKDELFNLSSSSKAALAYAGHAQIR
jgi:hypothetical protein